MKDKTPNKDRKKNGVQDATKKRRVRKLTLKGFLTAIVIAVMIRQIFMGNYENVFMCGLTLVLFAVPLFIDRKLGIDIPPGLEAVVLCFIFAAEILGEVDSFYTRIKHWDTMLHTVNGFLMAAVGFALVNANRK